MDMLVKLYDLPDSRGSFERLRQRGIHIRRALTAEKHKVAAWVRENFAEGWASETEIAFGRQPISCFIAVKAGKIAGFACHDVTCRNFFGPTGVEPESRKNGVGTALLSSAASARRTTIRKPSAQFPSTVRSPEFIVGYLIPPGLDFCDCQFPL